MTSTVSGALRVGRPVTSLKTIIRQHTTGNTGRKIEKQKVTLIDYLIPPGVIVGYFMIAYTTKQNQTGYYGTGWLGELWAPFGKLVYRKPIADQIKEQKAEDYKKGKYWPWRIWVG
jgi:hypothetical protein